MVDLGQTYMVMGVDDGPSLDVFSFPMTQETQDYEYVQAATGVESVEVLAKRGRAGSSRLQDTG